MFIGLMFLLCGVFVICLVFSLIVVILGWVDVVIFDFCFDGDFGYCELCVVFDVGFFV